MKKFNLTWTPPVNNGGAEITGHDVGYTPSGGSETVVATGSTAAAYTLTGLTDGTDYSVRVRAENSAGKGAWTGAVTQAAALAPSQVTGLAVDSTGDGTIDLSWSAPASEAAISDYSVEYTPSGGSLTTVLVGSAATSYQLTGLTNDTEHSVRVAAVSAGGTGAYSAAVTGTPVSGPVALTFTQTASGCSPSWQVGNIPASAATIGVAVTGGSARGGGVVDTGTYSVGVPESIRFGTYLYINYQGSGVFSTGVNFDGDHNFTATIQVQDSAGVVIGEIAGTSWIKPDCGGD